MVIPLIRKTNTKTCTALCLPFLLQLHPNEDTSALVSYLLYFAASCLCVSSHCLQSLTPCVWLIVAPAVAIKTEFSRDFHRTFCELPKFSARFHFHTFLSRVLQRSGEFNAGWHFTLIVSFSLHYFLCQCFVGNCTCHLRMSFHQPLTAPLEDVQTPTTTTTTSTMMMMMKLSPYLDHTVWGWRVAGWSSYGPDSTPLDISVTSASMKQCLNGPDLSTF